MPSAVWVVSSAFVAIAACTSDPPPEECAGVDYVPRVHDGRFADLPMFQPLAYMTNSDLEIRLGYGGVPPDDYLRFGSRIPVQGVLDGDGAYCPNLSFTATLDGVTQRIDWQGGWNCFGPSGAACAMPQLTIPAPRRTPDAHLVLADRSDSVDVPVGELFAERSVTLAGDWSFHPGQTIWVTWSPAADLSPPRKAYVELDIPCTNCPGGKTAMQLGQAIVSGAMIGVTLPEVVATGTLVFSLAYVPVDRRTYYLLDGPIASHDVIIAP